MSRIKTDRSLESSDTKSLGNRLPLHPTVRLPAVLLATVLSLFMTVPSNADDCPDPNPGPIPCPDEHAWELLAEQLAQPANNGSNDVLFETWATDRDTFPSAPTPLPTCDPLCTCTDPQASCETACPCWPGPDHRPDELSSISQAPGPSCDFSCAGATCEVVYHNRAQFDYFVENDLWYTEGAVRALFGPNAIPGGISFPTDSIAVKAVYVSGNDGQCDPENNCRSFGDYHCNVAMTPCNGDTTSDCCIALVALHIMSREVPNWFWATFEQKDNPGQCDYIGCHDSFGLESGMVPPGEGCGPTMTACPSDCPSDPIQCAISCPPCGAIYTSDLTTQAKDLLRENLGTTSAIWENYRLKGTQLDFLDGGEPTHLGNSVTESGFVPTSSCITCHSRATLSNQIPTKALNIFNCQCSSTPNGCTFGDASCPCTCSGNDGFLGAQDGNWYTEGGVEFRTTEFSWAIPFSAKSTGPDHPGVIPPSYFADLPQCGAATGACCNDATGACEDAITELQCQCPECEWSVDAACVDVECGAMPRACIFGQLGLIAISMMLVALCWMRLNRYRRVTRRSSNQEKSI